MSSVPILAVFLTYFMALRYRAPSPLCTALLGNCSFKLQGFCFYLRVSAHTTHCDLWDDSKHKWCVLAASKKVSVAMAATHLVRKSCQ